MQPRRRAALDGLAGRPGLVCRAVARPPKGADPGLGSATGLLDVPSPPREGLNSGVEYFDWYQSHGRPGMERAACLPLR